ncbi:MAG: hypothetical protein JXK05_07905 [Campylobacterales bacterium]|nr:hypothetical protein [Campylobacterales bacterium]
MAFWIGAILTLFVLMAREYHDKMQSVAKNIVHAALKQDAAFRFWATSHGGVYIKTSDSVKPNPHLSHVPHRDVVTEEVNLTLMNPASILRQVMNEHAGLYGLKGRVIGLSTLNQENNTMNPWERKILLELMRTKKSDIVYEFTLSDQEKNFKHFNRSSQHQVALNATLFKGMKQEIFAEASLCLCLWRP